MSASSSGSPIDPRRAGRVDRIRPDGLSCRVGRVGAEGRAVANAPRDLRRYASARHYFGAELRLLREQAGLSQDRLGKLVSYSGDLIAAVEKAQRWPTAGLVEAVDEALATGGALARLFPLMKAQRPSRAGPEAGAPAPHPEVSGVITPALDMPPAEASAASAAEALESPLDIVRRTQAAAESSVDDAVLIMLDQLVDYAIRQYEYVGPQALAPAIVEQRQWVGRTMLTTQHPRHRDRLFVLAAELSGILAALALDLGRLVTARSYAVEAFRLAELVQRLDVQAWVRGTQSLIEYYAGRYMEALAFAHDGQRLQPDGPQMVRLLVNGEARALGRLGDEVGARRAVDRSYQLLATPNGTRVASASLDRSPYCEVRTAANAATAFLSLGQATEVIELARRVLPVFDAQELRGPQALTRLDVASALAVDRRTGTGEEVASLVRESLTVASAVPFQPVVHRAAELLSGLEAWQRTPAIVEIEELHRELTATVGSTEG